MPPFLTKIDELAQYILTKATEFKGHKFLQHFQDKLTTDQLADIILLPYRTGFMVVSKRKNREY
jgi:hypothetical protein